MAEMNVEHINPFLKASTTILKDMCQISASVGKPYVRTTEFDSDTVIIIIGITGELRGQVVIGFPIAAACDVASKMMMMPVDEMNEITMSAISELGNMILGNAATIFSTQGILIDITPPTICRGNMSIMSAYAKNICIPLGYDNGKKIELDVAVRREA